jgi:hypothetical protein
LATQSVADLQVGVNDDPDTLEGIDRVQAWVARLSRALDARQAETQLLRDYYNGVHPLAFATKKWRETFGDTFGQIVDNWGLIVIDSATERMVIEGFRRPDEKDDPANAAAQAIWRRCNMKVAAQVAHTDALVTAYSYVSVGKGRNGKALIRVEDPAQTIVEHDPETGVDRLAALKRWRGVDGSMHATLYLPDMIVRLRGSAPGTFGVGWYPTSGPQPNPLGVVPVLEMANSPDVNGYGRSDLLPMMSLGNAVEKLLGDMMIASEFAAYRQRVLIGVETPINPLTGEPDASLVGGINRMFVVEDENAKIHEFSAADLSNYTGPIELLVQHIAALTKTPPHYLLGQVVNVSGDALAAAESGLVSRVRRRIELVDGIWSEAMGLALQIDGFANVDVDPVWMNPERVSDAARADALMKLRTLGVPLEVIFEDLTTPDKVQRWMAAHAREAELEGVAAGISGESGLPTQASGDPTLTE